MVELNYVSSRETSGFKDGANIRLSAVFNTLEDDQILTSQDGVEIVNGMFNNSTTHDTLLNIHSDLTESLSTYNRETIAKIFDQIVGYSNQTYYDIICIIRSIIEMQDNNEKVAFFSQIMNVHNMENEINAEIGEKQNNDDCPTESEDNCEACEDDRDDSEEEA